MRWTHGAESCHLPSCGLLDQSRGAAYLNWKAGGFPNVNWRGERLISCYPFPHPRGKDGWENGGCEQMVQNGNRVAKLCIFVQFSNMWAVSFKKIIIIRGHSFVLLPDVSNIWVLALGFCIEGEKKMNASNTLTVNLSSPLKYNSADKWERKGTWETANVCPKYIELISANSEQGQRRVWIFLLHYSVL